MSARTSKARPDAPDVCATGVVGPLPAYPGSAPVSAPAVAATTALDWAMPASVTAAMERGAWAQLEARFAATNPAHVETALALLEAERRELVRHGHFATHLANAALYRLQAGDFAQALTLYDAAVEGPLDARAAANPLYAVQDDNHHLGVDARRARRYLERCLPAGPANPTVWVNAACVFMELDEPAEALRVLALAKAAGLALAQYAGERLFAPLREDAEFQRLIQ